MDVAREVDPPGPAAPFDRSLDRFERLSTSLVLLDDRPLPDLRREVLAFAADLTAHLTELPTLRSRGKVPAPPDPAAARLAAEHERFRASVTELKGLLEVVRHEDHGGHRQALGQYGRVLAEALRRHRAEERTREARGGVPPVATSARSPLANRNEVRREPAGGT